VPRKIEFCSSDDYRYAIGELLELKQTTTIEDYTAAFENLQFGICMHNDGFDDTFFVSQFIQGLKPDISGGVQVQVPKDVDEAKMLAKIQQQLGEKGKHKWPKSSSTGKFQSVPPNSEGKIAGQQSSLWKERQTLNYRKANNL